MYFHAENTRCRCKNKADVERLRKVNSKNLFFRYLEIIFVLW